MRSSSAEKLSKARPFIRKCPNHKVEEVVLRMALQRIVSKRIGVRAWMRLRKRKTEIKYSNSR